MVSLLDNAAPGGLLSAPRSDPRIAVLQQLLDPAVTKRHPFLPVMRTMRPTGDTMVPEEITSREFGAPQIAVDMLESFMLPGAVWKGYTPTMQDAAQFSLDTMLGGLLGTAPRNSLAANVWHGTPHKFAPEPGFPHGRPRLDKMGTGEGAQAYGPGFYTAESKGVGTSYRDDLTSLKRRMSLDGELLPTPSAFDANKVAKDFNVPESDANYLQAIVDDMHSSVKGGDVNSYIASRKSMLDLYPENSGDEIVDMLRGSYEAQIRVAEKYKDRLKPATGTLYKLDIPDADAAKTLDWDAPLSEQPIAVREALNQSVIQRNRLDDELKKIERQINTEASLNPADASSFDSFFASPMSDKFNALIDRKIELQKEITDLPDRGFIAEVVKNNPDITGGDFFNLLKRNAGRLTGANPNRTQAESSSAVADALREAGVPGVKYLDQGSRGAGEGSRNYAIWDQDVLNRTKMLERDGVTLGANKSPTAATAGLLSRSPLEERATGANAFSRGPNLTQQQFNDVFLSRSKQRQNWALERKAEREELMRQVVETQRQRGVNSLYGKPPFTDPLIINKRMRSFKADKLRKAKPYKNMGQGLWSKTFEKEVERAAGMPDLFDVGSTISRANMEAVPRALKKEGWTVRHVSKGRDGRVSSRYLVSPDESYEIRLTDHYLPETAERFHRMTQGQGSRWNDEIILDGDERPAEIIQQIKSSFKGLLD